MGDLDIIIPWQGWKPVRYIGSGAYGRVYEIERIHYGQKEKAALKYMTLPKERGEVEDLYADGYDEAGVRVLYRDSLKEIENEYHLLRQMKGHPNFVNCEDYCEIEHKNDIGWDIYIRMELLNPLLNYLKSTVVTESDIIKLGKDISRALQICEEKKIIHRDIKPSNILVSEYGDFKIGDFGVAKTMDHTTQATRAGTQYYMAPEVYWQEPYGKEVDIYSLGLVMYWLLNRRRIPFLPINKTPTLKEKEAAKNRRLRGEKLPEPVDGSRALKKIVLKACAYRKEDRYRSAGQMLAELEKLDFQKLEDVESVVVTGRTEGTFSASGTGSGRKTSGTGSKASQTGSNSSGRKKTEGHETVGNRWEDTDGTIGKKPGNGKQGAGDVESTEGTQGKKRKAKTPPDNRNSKKKSIDTGTGSKDPDTGKSYIPPDYKPPEKKTSNSSDDTSCLGCIGYILLIIVAVLAIRYAFKKFNGTVDWSKYDPQTCVELDLSESNIKSIKGIEEFTNLEKLILDKNKIKDISSLKELKNLKYLSINNNQLTDISSIGRLTNLEHLSLMNNQIRDIDSLAGLEKLSILHLERNQISDIRSIGELTNLEYLYLGENQIVDISSLSALTNLTYLSLTQNHIKDISSIGRLTNLRILSIYDNQISDVSGLRGLKSIEYISLWKNQISDISSLSSLISLTNLDLKENQIKDIESLKNLKGLEKLELGNNQIKDISSLNDLKNLRLLDLSENRIKNINSLKELRNLTNLYLGKNQISDISSLSNLKNLETIFLYDNQISDIACLKELYYLETLHLNNNQISDINALGSLFTLKTLDLSNNQIEDVSALGGLTNLQTLELTNNPISDYSPVDNLKIKYLRK